MGKLAAIAVIYVWTKTKTKLMLEGFADGKPDSVWSSLKLQFQEKSYSSIGIDEHAQITMEMCVFHQAKDQSLSWWFSRNIFERKQMPCTIFLPLSFLQAL